MKVAINKSTIEENRTIITDVTVNNPLIEGGKYKILHGGANIYYLHPTDNDLLAYCPSGKYSHNWGIFTVLGAETVSCMTSQNATEEVKGILILGPEEKLYILEDGDFILEYEGKEELDQVTV